MLVYQAAPPQSGAALQRQEHASAPVSASGAVASGPTRADILRGAYGPYRANNDLLSYKLQVRVDPDAKTIAGSNTVRFRMLADGTRIQLDLTEQLAIDKILFEGRKLHYTRDSGAVFVDFPRPLRRGHTYAVDFFYSGHPIAKGRFGGMNFETDPAGRPWIFTACEDDGSSIWWPSKDQWRDEPDEGMEIAVAVPNALTDVSNGRFVGKRDLGDGYTEWTWRVSYPINSYDVALNIGEYSHFADTFKHPGDPDLPLDFYALPEDLEKAKLQFAQAKTMLDAFTHFFGPYPFARDGYKLIEVPYAGMEHQSAVAYGNGFHNSYGDFNHGDWTGVGISPRFDFIIIHESGHEWFGNAVSAADRADMWIHEGWTTYLETLFVEHEYGRADAIRYTDSLAAKVKNKAPIVGEEGVNADPPQDQYFKGALMIATLRSVLGIGQPEPAADTRWFSLIRAFYDRFKYKTTSTVEVVGWWNDATHQDLTPFFDQYLRHAAIPTLELNFNPLDGTVAYKWRADEPGFQMPVAAGDPQHWSTLHPTASWQTLKTPLSREDFQVATDLFYIKVSKT